MVGTPTSAIEGRNGTAVPMLLPDATIMAPIIQHWLLNLSYSPARRYFILAATTLRDMPGFTAARLDMPDVTHEVSVNPLDPAAGPQDPATVLRDLTSQALPLLPRDALRYQVQATDDEMLAILPNIAWQIADTGWNPDATMVPGIHGDWRTLVRSHLSRLRNAMARRASGPQTVANGQQTGPQRALRGAPAT